MLILVDLVQTHVFYLILLPTLIDIHVLIYRILMHHILLLITTTLLPELIIFLSESFSRAMDNHLFSDHVPLKLILHISVDYIPLTSRPFSVKQAWFKATQCNIDTYKTRLDNILDRDDQYCSVDKDEIVDLVHLK